LVSRPILFDNYLRTYRFKAAQPALLYLVPACIGAPLLLAAIRGEVSTLWNYTEVQFVKQDDDSKKKKAE
jgi:minor histocompatibility antigen H13